MQYSSQVTNPDLTNRVKFPKKLTTLVRQYMQNHPHLQPDDPHTIQAIAQIMKKIIPPEDLQKFADVVEKNGPILAVGESFPVDKLPIASRLKVKKVDRLSLLLPEKSRTVRAASQAFTFLLNQHLEGGDREDPYHLVTKYKGSIGETKSSKGDGRLEWHVDGVFNGMTGNHITSEHTKLPNLAPTIALVGLSAGKPTTQTLFIHRDDALKGIPKDLEPELWKPIFIARGGPASGKYQSVERKVSILSEGKDGLELRFFDDLKRFSPEPENEKAQTIHNIICENLKHIAPISVEVNRGDIAISDNAHLHNRDKVVDPEKRALMRLEFGTGPVKDVDTASLISVNKLLETRGEKARKLLGDISKSIPKFLNTR